MIDGDDLSVSKTRVQQDHINVDYYFKELLLTYKYGEKFKYRRALDKLGPYMSDILKEIFEEVYEQSLWTNPLARK